MAETLENPVTVETPLETVETPLETLETPLETLETPLTTPQPKKKGRPAGAKSGVQGKPRPKRVETNRIRRESMREPEPDDPEPDELPPPLPNSRRIPQVSHDDSSALMLTLLRKQAADRRQRKVDVWKSWFN